MEALPQHAKKDEDVNKDSKSWDLLAIKRLLTSIESLLDDHRQVLVNGLTTFCFFSNLFETILFIDVISCHDVLLPCAGDANQPIGVHVGVAQPARVHRVEQRHQDACAHGLLRGLAHAFARNASPPPPADDAAGGAHGHQATGLAPGDQSA